MNNESQIAIINKEINKELTCPEVSRALLATTFKGLTPVVMKQAIMDGMIRGFTFLNFRQKDVYAIPFGQGYSLITSIDYSRKIGMRSGVVGKTAPTFEMDGKKIISCTITIKKKVGEFIGDFSETVYFDEYSTGRNLWISKPRTMIAKVAEMHALRMACPEELAKQYIEEEMEASSDSIISDRLAPAMQESESLKIGANLKMDKKEEAPEVPASAPDICGKCGATLADDCEGGFIPCDCVKPKKK